MYKVLLWKEYRETRFTILILAMIVLIVPRLFLGFFPEIPPKSFVDALFRLIAFLSIMITGVTALLLGADIFAGEKQMGLLEFLESMPVPLKTIWWTKFIYRLFALCIITIAYSLIPKEFDVLNKKFPLFSQIAPILAVFSLSVFYSTIMNKTIHAGCAGIGTYILFLFFFRFVSEYPTLCTYLVIFLSLGASFWIFTLKDFSD